MSTRTDIIAAAEKAFDGGGFHGTGMDALVRAAGVSSRTLYKHVGSKDELALSVLKARQERFEQAVDGDGVDGLFTGLQRWIDREGANGCLFLRAHGEYRSRHPAFAALVREHKDAFAREIARRVEQELGRPDEALAAEIEILFEGATAAAVYRGAAAAVESARRAARALLAAGRAAS
ncbi:TetR/AcrR family transcriptional regulator [Lutibaculum baratangense]|uniref:Transcriptional regulator, TetR family n=1 Tax=Lutibaculum baratangense AMV1 TaxID=631454 RepID=V4RIR3_9HYPH|nr:TetR/AcrR family transcriptional regulator [Lutibaculum baratangense]ESR25976.1 Transcriptional regulator, TetR family [Lutibaculum baratangense AMV1]